MKKNKLIFLLVFGLCVFYRIEKIDARQEDSSEIVVRLATESQLMPLYLAKIADAQSGFEASYLEQLENILLFDLSHNGMTQVVKRTTEQENLADKLLREKNENASDWRISHIFYVIKATVTDRKLKTSMLSVTSNTIKNSQGIALTGNLDHDRRLIHQLADTIHRALFGTEGVASTRFLYTLRQNVSKDKGKNQWTSEVWEADYDGGNFHQITHDGSYCITPIYIPPKEGYHSGSLVYVSYQIGQPKIYVASLKDGVGYRFSSLKGNQLMPAISRQRDKVAFINDVTGNPDLFIQSFNPEIGAIGKPQQIYATHQATQGSPTFSPDGRRLAFVSNKDGSPRIYMMDIPSLGVSLKDIKATLLTKHSKESTAPNWSPDGTKLAYCAMTNGFRQIWIYDFEKGNERQITQGRGHKENPTWAPNSLHLVFNSTDADSCELYLINLNQPNAVKISSGTGEKRFPCWEVR